MASYGVASILMIMPMPLTNGSSRDAGPGAKKNTNNDSQEIRFTLNETTDQ